MSVDYRPDYDPADVDSDYGHTGGDITVPTFTANMKPFRFWCQKALPLVYDDSLSYYEVLCKVVKQMNDFLTDLQTATGAIDQFAQQFVINQQFLNDMADQLGQNVQDLEDYINDRLKDYMTAYTQLQNYVNNYFDNLDVQQEINNKLDEMSEDGTFNTLFDPVITAWMTAKTAQIDAAIANQDAIQAQQNGRISVLEGRMDTFDSLPAGSTAGNAELIGIRTNFLGEVYPTAGDAVRASDMIASGFQSISATKLEEWDGNDNSSVYDTIQIDISGYKGGHVVVIGSFKYFQSDLNNTGSCAVYATNTPGEVEDANAVNYLPGTSNSIFTNFTQITTSISGEERLLLQFAIPDDFSYQYLKIGHFEHNPVSGNYTEPLYIVYANSWSKTQVDPTLSITGDAADAKATGDALDELNERFGYVADGDTVAFLNNINYLYGTPINGYYNPYTGTGVGQNADWSYYPLFEIEGGFYYCASYNGAHVAFYDEDKEYISGVLVNNGATNFDFLAPSNAKYATYSYLTASGDQYFMRSTKQAVEYTDPKFKTLGFDVTLEPFHFLSIMNFGKNLFNKFNLIEGFCLDYGNGARIWRNSSYCYCPDYIPAEASTAYYRNRPCIIVEYDEDLNVLETHNFTSTYNGSFTTESSTTFLRISTLLTHVDALQVEKGTAESDYQAFGYSLKHSVDKLAIHTVKTDGTGDYQTISEAVASASDDDIILVYPGTYNESVHAYSKKIHLVGLNRKSCILSYSGLDYSNPPLEMAKGSVRNLTILATNSGTEGDRPAYCVHIDNDNEAGEALSFFNVDFINAVHQAVGIGLRANFTLTFDTCRFESVDQGALYCHDWETSDSSADKTGQNLIVRNCSIVNNSSSKASIMLQSQELVDKGATAVFIGNTVVNKGGSSLISMTLWSGRTLTNTNFLNSSDWVLSVDSNLNTLDTINSSSNNIAYTQATSLLSRVGSVSGGYCKIGRIVYVNTSFTCLADHTGTPSVLGGFPKPLNNNAVLTCVKANNGLGSALQESILCGINNTSMYVNKITTNDVYYVTGVYISET